MQALARLFLNLGHQVSGSDMHDFAERKKLENQGAKVFVGHDRSHITPVINEVIFSAAIPKRNVEFKEARRLGLPLKGRAEALGDLMKKKKGIAVAGTHGKTTTSAMLATILKEAKLFPTLAIGGEVKSIKSSAELGKGNLMVVEACEYQRSFLKLKPKLAIITNIEADHLDYYRNLEGVKKAFSEFASLLPRRGTLFAWGDSHDVLEVAQKARCPVIRFGFDSSNDWQADNLVFRGGFSVFDVLGSKETFRIRLPLPGRHLVLDALAALACARFLGIKKEIIQKSLGHFKGSGRRFEILGRIKGITIVDDYGHHPTEIRAVLEATRASFPHSRILVAFQPHQLSRTRILLDDFARSFKRADEVLVAPIYSVRDSSNEKIRAADLVRAINGFSHNARAAKSFDGMLSFLRQKAEGGDVILTLGAGETDKFARRLLKEL